MCQSRTRPRIGGSISPHQPGAWRADPRAAVDITSALLVAVLVIACTDRRADRTRPETSAVSDKQPADRIEPGSRAREPTASVVSSVDSLRFFVRSLDTLGGTFTVTSAGGWTFSGDATVFTRIGNFGDAAVAELVSCLGRSNPSRALLDAKPVPVGVLCYEALRRTAYYEAYEERGESSNKYERWTGHLRPNATPAQLRAAAEAWRQVVARKAYRLL
jgi:hypothetical protein